MKKFLAAAAATVVLGWAGTAGAASITIDASRVNNPFTVLFNGMGGDPLQVVPNLTAEATFTLTSLTPTQAVFNVVLNNTTSGSVGSVLMSIGFNTTPNVSTASASDPNGAWDYAFINSGGDTQFPNGIGKLDACADTGSNGCTGGNPQNGISKGGSADFQLTLGFSPQLSPVSFVFDAFHVRYQVITGAGNITSGTGDGCIEGTDDCGDDSKPMPEPTSMLLLGAGLLGLAAKARRRR